MKTVSQLEDESTAAREAADAAHAKAEDLEKAFKLIGALEEVSTSSSLSGAEGAPLRALGLTGVWLALEALSKSAKVEARRLENAADEAQQAFIAAWEAA